MPQPHYLDRKLVSGSRHIARSMRIYRTTRSCTFYSKVYGAHPGAALRRTTCGPAHVMEPPRISNFEKRVSTEVCLSSVAFSRLTRFTGCRLVVTASQVELGATSPFCSGMLVERCAPSNVQAIAFEYNADRESAKEAELRLCAFTWSIPVILHSESA